MPRETNLDRQQNFARRFKPCSLVMFYAHNHRTNSYLVTDREASVLEDGTELSSWKTTKEVKDPVNANKSQALRAGFIKAVTKLGAQYGSEKLVFIDYERVPDLGVLRAEWIQKVQEFNAQSPLVKLDLGTLPPLNLTGENEYMLGNLLEELRDTMGTMQRALVAADYSGINQVVRRLKGFVSLVPDTQSSAIVAAINDAKRQARAMKKALTKKGKTIEEVQAQISTAQVDLAAAACLFDDDADETGPTGADLLEAQAQEFCAAVLDDGEVEGVTDQGDQGDGPAGESSTGLKGPDQDVAVVLDEAPVMDQDDSREPEGSVLAASSYGPSGEQGYWF